MKIDFKQLCFMFITIVIILSKVGKTLLTIGWHKIVK